jgi:predicted aspartyl protease
VHVDVRLGGVTIRALVDTGATICAIAKEAFDKLERDVVVGKVPSGSLRITAANNGAMQIDGVFRLNFEVSGRKVTWPMAVIRNLSSEMIIGDDLLVELGARVDVRRRQIELQDPDKVSCISTRHRVVIPPFATRRIKVQIGREMPTDLVWIHPKRVEILEGIQSNVAGSVNLIAFNGRTQECIIEAGEELATYAPVDARDTCTVAKFRECRPCPRTEPVISEEKRQMIRQKTRSGWQGSAKEKLVDLLIKNHAAISEDKGDLGRTNVVPHKLTLRSEKQIYRSQFPIPIAHMPFVHRTVDDLLKLGAIEPDLKSPHNSPIFCVKKPHSDDLRLVQDLRLLNENVEDYFHPILDVQSCLAKLGGIGAKYFATLDLTSGFYQLELDEESRPLTAFTVPGRGRFSWKVSTMGLKTSPGAFSRLMEFVMQPVEKSVTYMDDVILAGETVEQLMETVDQALKQLRKYNLKLNLDKCIFGAMEVDYLGYRISAEGIRPGAEKTAAIKSFPTPSTVQEVRRFVGLANYFRQQIPHFSQKSKPLTQLTRQTSAWTRGPLPREAQQAFEQLRSALAAAPLTAFPQPGKPYILETDASEKGLGACLFQIQGGEKRVIGFASKGLEEHEKNYTAFLLEHRAAVFGIEYFRHLLTGTKFDLVMDHKPLAPLSTVHKKTLCRLQQLMSEFSFHLKYKPGKDNVVADTLSRAPVEVLTDSYVSLREMQLEDRFCRIAIRALEKGKVDEELEPAEKRFMASIFTRCFMKGGCAFLAWNDPVTGKRELLLTPQKCRYELVRAAHAHRFSGHGGIEKTLSRLRLRYFWPGMAADVEKYVTRCGVCQEAKSPPNRSTRAAPLRPLPIPDMPNVRVHLDLFAVPRRSSSGNKYVLVITDAFSKWTELVAIPDKEAVTVASAFFNRWICRWACPKEILTDRGKEFCNQLMTELARLLDIDHKRTAAYHPQTNTAAESFNRTLIKILTAALEDPDGDWEAWLPVVTLTYNTRVHASTKASPFFLTFLRDPNLPTFDLDDEGQRPYGDSWAADAHERMQIAYRLAKANAESAQAVGKSIHDRKLRGDQLHFKVGDKVYVHFPPTVFARIQNKKFIRPWIKHVVTRIVTPTTYVVKPIDEGATKRRQPSVVHVNRLKACKESAQEAEAEEPEAPAREEESSGSDQEAPEEEEEERAEVEVGVYPPPAENLDRQGVEEAEQGAIPREPQQEEVRPQPPREQGPRTRRQVRENQALRPDQNLTPPRRPIEYKVYTRRQR